jgi:hypothetical protein
MMGSAGSLEKSNDIMILKIQTADEAAKCRKNRPAGEVSVLSKTRVARG